MSMLLLSTTSDAMGEGDLRFARIGMGRKVTATGSVQLADLPPGEARLAFYTRTAFFSHVETKKQPAKMLPIQVRRLIDAELAFNEPFRACQRVTAAGEGRQDLAMAAVAEADYALVVSRLPLVQRPFACITAIECALAALVGQVTKEPVRLLWRRDKHLLGLLVERGEIYARHAARVEGGVAQDEAAFAERVLPLLSTAANRSGRAGITGRDVVITLALGEWGELPEGGDGKIGAGVQSQLQALFPGAPVGDVSTWPELYGLPFVSADFSFLTPGYQTEVDGVRLTRPLLWAAAGATVLFAMVAAFASIQANGINSQREVRSNALQSKLQSVGLLPNPDDIEKLKRRLGVQSTLEGIRLDRFLAWVSKNTPKGVIIRKLEVNRDTSVATVPAPPSSIPNSEPVPVQSWKAAIEYEVPGAYAEAEIKSAAIMAALGNKSKLITSALNVKNDAPTRLTINLVTQETVFSE
ncbi:MAG: hypothetical protein HHJ12_05685 [Glaciimonas sp.]|nr:hypothetical protein [Glaciimonas sp.]